MDKMAESNGERLAKLETGLEYIRTKVDHIDVRIDTFFTLLDSKYAEKENVVKLENSLEELKKEVENNRSFILRLTGGLGVAIVVIEILLKFFV